jgi:hypothetical protein
MMESLDEDGGRQSPQGMQRHRPNHGRQSESKRLCDARQGLRAVVIQMTRLSTAKMQKPLTSQGFSPVDRAGLEPAILRRTKYSCYQQGICTT